MDMTGIQSHLCFVVSQPSASFNFKRLRRDYRIHSPAYTYGNKCFSIFRIKQNVINNAQCVAFNVFDIGADKIFGGAELLALARLGCDGGVVSRRDVRNRRRHGVIDLSQGRAGQHACSATEDPLRSR